MKKLIRLIDANGFFICDDFTEELNEFTIEIPCPEGFYKPKWNGSTWVEGLTQAEIDAIKATPQEPTEVDRLDALEDAMLFII